MLTCILFIFVTGLLALSGYDTSAPVINDTVDPTLSILTPNGGEAWYIGDTNDITWTASEQNNSKKQGEKHETQTTCGCLSAFMRRQHFCSHRIR